MTSVYLRASFLVILFSLGCSNKSFETVPGRAKATKLETETVFPPTTGGIGTGAIPVIGNGSVGVGTNPTCIGCPPTTGGTVGTGGTTAVIPSPVLPPAENPYLNVGFVCSDKRSDVNGNLATAPSLTVEILTQKDLKQVCSFTSQNLATLLTTYKKFPLQLLADSCGQIADGMYVLRIRDSSKSADTNLVLSRTCNDGHPIIKAGTWQVSDVRLDLITDRNPNPNSPDGSTDTHIAGIKCDRIASPLVIHMQPENLGKDYLKLTSQQDGIMFDILGANSYNAPYTPKRISWHRSNQYLFVVLPDAAGRVKGIDQMFGDNTIGPDGRFALNGYDALAKFDGTSADGRLKLIKPDGFIDERDPIYHALRLWQDKNFDGVAEASELFTLSALGIKLIDLRYDPRFQEVDKYGNETRYKSVVLTKTNRMLLIFDVWFKYNEH